VLTEEMLSLETEMLSAEVSNEGWAPGGGADGDVVV
jgi:hypothetical protein